MGVDVTQCSDWVPAVGVQWRWRCTQALKGIYLHTYLKGNWRMHTDTPHVLRLPMHTPTQMSHTSTHTTHTPPTHPTTTRVPWTHTSCNAWRSLPPALTSYGYLASHLDYQTTVSLSLLHSSLQSPTSRATCRKEQCSSRMCTRMNQTQSQGFCDILQFLLPSYQPSLQLEAWQNIHQETNHRATNHTRSLTTWATGWYQLIMLSPTCWVHSWPGCSSGKDTASLQATWEW